MAVLSSLSRFLLCSPGRQKERDPSRLIQIFVHEFPDLRETYLQDFFRVNDLYQLRRCCKGLHEVDWVFRNEQSVKRAFLDLGQNFVLSLRAQTKAEIDNYEDVERGKI